MTTPTKEQRDELRKAAKNLEGNMVICTFCFHRYSEACASCPRCRLVNKYSVPADPPRMKAQPASVDASAAVDKAWARFQAVVTDGKSASEILERMPQHSVAQKGQADERTYEDGTAQPASGVAQEQVGQWRQEWLEAYLAGTELLPEFLCIAQRAYQAGLRRAAEICTEMAQDHICEGEYCDSAGPALERAADTIEQEAKK